MAAPGISLPQAFRQTITNENRREESIFAPVV